MPQRIQQRRTRGWRKPEGAVAVGRGTRWGNPFKVGRRYVRFHTLGWGMPTSRDLGPLGDGKHAEVVELADRSEAVEMFRAWTRSRMTTMKPPLDLSPLAGHNLMCWCPLDQPCHADVLLELANPPAEEA